MDSVVNIIKNPRPEIADPGPRHFVRRRRTPIEQGGDGRRWFGGVRGVNLEDGDNLPFVAALTTREVSCEGGKEGERGGRDWVVSVFLPDIEASGSGFVTSGLGFVACASGLVDLPSNASPLPRLNTHLLTDIKVGESFRLGCRGKEVKGT